MSNLLRPVAPVDNSVISSWMNNAVKHSNNNSLGMGSNVHSIANDSGFSITIPTNPNPQALRYAGVYDEYGEYSPNDVVYVDSNVSYSFATASNYSAGAFLCIKSVPIKGQDKTYFLNKIVGAYNSASLTPTDAVANAYQWNDYNIYYPCFPIPTGPSTVTDSGYTINTSQSYWIPLGTAAQTIQVDICVNGISKTAYLYGYWSGSV